MIISLPRKDRRLMSDVASLYQRTIAEQDLGVDNAQTFWRISMYVKVGYLKKQDVRDILHAMEAFSEILKKNPRKDPTGAYKELPDVIERLRALMERKHVSENDEYTEFGIK